MRNRDMLNRDRGLSFEGRGIRLRKNGAGARGIIIHLRDQSLCAALEPRLRAQEGEEFHIGLRTIEIAGKIEQEGLQERRPVIEGRAPDRSLRRRSCSAPVDRHAHRIDAMAQGRRRHAAPCSPVG